MITNSAHRGVGEDRNPFINSPYPIHNIFSHLLHHCVTNSLHTFSKHQCHLILLAHSSIFLQPLSCTYNSAHLICQYPLISLKFLMSPINAPHLLLHYSHTLHTSYLVPLLLCTILYRFNVLLLLTSSTQFFLFLIFIFSFQLHTAP